VGEVTKPTLVPIDLSATADPAYTRLLKAARSGRRPDDPTDEEWADYLRLEAAGLAQTYESATYRSATPIILDPRYGYFEAFEGTRPHGWYVQVTAPSDLASRGVLLIRAAGCSFDRTDRNPDVGMPVWSVRTRHATATDFEHDSSTLMTFDLVNPVLVSTLDDTSMSFAGHLRGVRAYSPGQTMFDDDLQYPVGRNASPCTTCDPPHPFGAYMPPERPELDGKIVTVTLWAMALVGPAEVPAVPAPAAVV
jgi:hypothetical protein